MLERVKRTRKGDFKMILTADERAVLGGLPSQLRSLLAEGDAGDPAHARLFPAAFVDDPERSQAFADLVHGDLVRQRMDALDTFERTLADARLQTRLSEDELLAWLGVLNDLRLVLGVRLDVTEETTDRDFVDGSEERRLFSLYRFLSYLVDQIVGALSA